MRDRIKELRRVRAADLIPNDANWRRHPEAQRQALRTVLGSIGIADAAIAYERADGALVLIDGHLRQEEVGDDGMLPVLVLDVNENEAGQLLGTLDPLAAMATTDKDAQRDLVRSLTANADMKLLLETIAGAGSRQPEPKADDVPDLPAVPKCKKGDTYKLGPHFVLCGDSFEDATGERIDAIAGGKASVDMVLTDPPYAIYGSSSGVSSEVADDQMVRPFFASIGRVIAARLRWFGHAYVHCDWRSWASVWEGLQRGGLSPKNCLVWDKVSAGLGSSYANTHEFVGFFAKLPPEGAVMRRAGYEGQQRTVHRPNLLRHDRVRGEEREHNAAKPVALLEELIANSSDAGELVLDLFGGSGSTLIAADRAGRRCVTVEKDPKWCDAIAARWERLTGGTAELEAG